MKQEALKLALKALEANDQLINGTGTKGGLVYCMDGYYSDCFDVDPINKQTEEAITAIKEALAQEKALQALHSENERLGLYKEAYAQPEQEPVAWLEPEWGEKICPEVGYEMTMTDDHPRDLCWIPLYAHPPQNTNETDEEIKSKCPRTDSIWSLGWYEGYKACNKNTAQAYLKGFDEGCKSMLEKNQNEPVAYLTKRKIGGTEGLLRADMVDRSAKNQETHDFIPLYTTPPQRTWVGLTEEEFDDLRDNNFGVSPLISAVEAKLKEKNT